MCKYIGFIFEKIHSFACRQAFDDIFHHISLCYLSYNKRVVNFFVFGEDSWYKWGCVSLKQRLSTLFGGKTI